MSRKITTGEVGGAVGGLNVTNTTLTTADNVDIIVNPRGAGRFVIQGDAQLQAQGDLRFGDADSSNYVALQAPAVVSSNVLFTLPATDGSAGQVLSTAGDGNLSFTAPGISVTDQTLSSSTHYPPITTSTSGTLTGVNVSSTKFAFTPSTGQLSLAGNTASTSTTSGTLVVTGGAGVSGAFYAGSYGGNSTFTAATATTSPANGALVTCGGLGVGAQGRFVGDVFACGSSTGLQSQISAKLDTSAAPGALLYNCMGCWNGSAIIPVALRGVYSRYEVVGHTSYWQYFCSSASYAFGGACGGACAANFELFCCAHCSCGWVGDRKCMNGSNHYTCAGAISWPFGCSSGCDTACTIQGFNFHNTIVPNNVCCGSQRGFHYCFTMSNNGQPWCCIGNRNSGQAISCCGAHPACLRGVCYSTPSGSNPFACVTSVQILGYGRIL